MDDGVDRNIGAGLRENAAMTSRRSRPNLQPGALLTVLVVALGLMRPAAATAQACTGVTLDPPVTGTLDFGRLYVTTGMSGTATLDPGSGVVSTSGRLVAAQTGAPLSVRVIDASPDCEFILSTAPASRTLATDFTAVADRISVLEGSLLNADPGQRAWLVRMNNGVARILIGGVLEMSTPSDALIDSYTETFTVSVDPS